MQIFLFFALFIAVIAVIFAVQNNDQTTVSFIRWDIDGSLAFFLLIALAAGALISFFVSLPSNISTRWAIRQQRKKISELETKLEEKSADLDTLQHKLEGQQMIEEVTKPVEIQTPGNEESKLFDKK